MEKEALYACVTDVTTNVFKTMVYLSPVMKNVKEGNAAEKLPQCIISKVEFAGPAIGTFALHFRTDLALKITSNMLQANISEVNRDVDDAVMEICNMIAGGVKTKLAQMGIHVDYSLPMVEQDATFNVENDEGHVIAFDIEGHPFHISMTMNK